MIIHTCRLLQVRRYVAAHVGIHTGKCVLWVKFKKYVGKSVKVAFNNSFRIMHNLNMRCSASEMFVLNNVRSYPEMYRKSVYSFMKRLHSSVNLIIMTIANSDFNCNLRF